MKTALLLILCFTLANCPAYAQEELNRQPNKNSKIPPAVHLAPEVIPACDYLPKKPIQPTLQLYQKSRSQQINGLALFTGGSVMGWLGLRYYGKDWKKTAASGQFNNLNATAAGKLAITGLVMMAGSIPYFICALKNKHKAGFKLSCQKTSIGVNNRACRKVTGITYAIQIGK